MKYEDMSDFEINKAVANKMGGYVGSCGDWLKNGVKVRDAEYSFLHAERAYCSSPNDAWPIIVENRITVNPYDDESQGWTATFDTSFFIDDENPLRAAMICFLKMKDAEK